MLLTDSPYSAGIVSAYWVEQRLLHAEQSVLSNHAQNAKDLLEDDDVQPLTPLLARLEVMAEMVHQGRFSQLRSQLAATRKVCRTNRVQTDAMRSLLTTSP